MSCKQGVDALANVGVQKGLSYEGDYLVPVVARYTGPAGEGSSTAHLSPDEERELSGSYGGPEGKATHPSPGTN